MNQPVGTPPSSQLEAEVRWGLERDPRRWSAWTWAAPLLALVGLIVAGQVVTHLVTLHGQARVVTAGATSIIADLLLASVVFLCARGPARRGGGWAATFGVYRPRTADIGPWAAGFGVVFAARLAVGIVANDLTHGRATGESANLRLHNVHGAGLDLLIVAVVLAAPLVEELVFRGVLLRAFLRHMPFWPAALLSTALFAGFHVYEVATVVGALTLAAIVGVLGLANCVLIRVTGRLTPGIFVHASFNFIAVLVLAATGR